MRIILATLSALLTICGVSYGQSDLDFVRAQNEDDLGIVDVTRAAPMEAAGSERTSLVNFTTTGSVAQIDDGDTIDVKGKGGARFVIRFSDMDTPEVKHEAFTDNKCPCNSMPFRPGQPGGKAATAA